MWWWWWWGEGGGSIYSQRKVKSLDPPPQPPPPPPAPVNQYHSLRLVKILCSSATVKKFTFAVSTYISFFYFLFIFWFENIHRITVEKNNSQMSLYRKDEKKTQVVDNVQREKKNPANRIRTSDLRMTVSIPLQSSALPTELSRDDDSGVEKYVYIRIKLTVGHMTNFNVILLFHGLLKFNIS